MTSSDARLASLTINNYEDMSPDSRPNVFINPETAKRLKPIINHSLLTLNNFRLTSNERIETSYKQIPL